jgi:hypothetical protein
MRLSTMIDLTRVQGAAFDALLGLALGGVLARALDGPSWLTWTGLGLGALAGLRWTRARAARALERGRPAVRHALSAWLEGQGGSLRGRLEGWLEAQLRLRVIRVSAIPAVLALTLWALVPARQAVSVPRAPATAASPRALEARLHLEPPAYAHRPPSDVRGGRVEALRGTLVQLTWSGLPGALRVAEPGAPEQQLELVEGLAVQRFTLERSRSLRGAVPGSEAPVVLELIALPDEAPSVELEAPGEDRVVTSAPGAFAMRAQASDDVGLSRLALHYSLAQGSGEAMHFKSGVLGLRRDFEGLQASLEARVNPVALGMAAGDTLALWAEATDGNTLDGPAVARSGARLLKWEVPVLELSGGTGAMPPPPKSLLSQRELLARTERLVRRGLTGPALEAASAELAADQRALRTSFSQVLNTEAGSAVQLDVDEKEAAESTDTHAHALLAKAVSAMWDSETQLALSHPGASLPAQRAAVAALDAAFSLIRISLRPLRQPDKPVDESRRLSGSSKGLVPRAPAAAPKPAPEPRLTTLALSLLGGAAHGLEAAEARALADALWALPASAGVPSAELAAGLYGATSAEARVGAARLAGTTLARAARPARTTSPPADASGARMISRLPLRAPN